MTEKELVDYKAKYQAKDADFKEVNKELNRKLKELQNLTNKAHLSEQLHQEEIQSLKQDYEGKMKAMKEELDMARQGSESTSNASPGQTQISQQTDQRFQEIQNQMSMMMNQFQRMSVIQNPFGGGPTSDIS